MYIDIRINKYIMVENRTKTAAVTLTIGLVLNIALGVTKLVTGLLASSASVTSDAVNNLSDAAVSIITLAATLLAARAADAKHPFGHGRYEYIAEFILGAVIIAVGAEVLIGGVKRIITPENVKLDIAIWIALGISIAVKAFMAAFYTIYGKRINSDAIKAAAVDSASDCAVTTVVLVCAVVERSTGAHIDGYASVTVAVVIILFAVNILRSTISRLLGERPDKELYTRVMNILTQFSEVLSVHDLIINDYGANHKIAEADAVFDAEMSFPAVHAICDAAEKRVLSETGLKLCLHADPHVTDDSRLNTLKEELDVLLLPYGASAHDIAIDDEKLSVELDISLPNDKLPVNEIASSVEEQIKSLLPYEVKICIDYI